MHLLSLIFGVALSLSFLKVDARPHKLRAVNLGSWLVLEPWMLPAEWKAMGGENCDPCSDCIRSEFDFAKAYPDTVDQQFEKHWETWFNQPDVDELVRLKINAVRIPLGYWIIEALVDRKTEFFPRGGFKQLRRGLSQLRKAGIEVILDHHAVPGVQTYTQMFTGRCTPDVQFYTDQNYERALVWTAVMTALSHIDPVFGSVFSIQAVNEPIMDAHQTPGFGEFQKNFVLTVRIIEAILGIWVFDPAAPELIFSGETDIATAFGKVATDPEGHSKFPTQVLQAIAEAAPIIQELVHGSAYKQPNDYDDEGALLSLTFDLDTFKHRKPLITNFMDVNWQFNFPANPADAAIGPISFDNHLYYSFGGVADPDPEAYLISICNLRRVENDAALGNSPLWFGEWALPTQFNATDEFLRKWGDAQKLAYNKGYGWIFWSFKIEISEEAGDTAREWSYFEATRRGLLTEDPEDYHDPHVCDPYYGRTYTATSTTTQASSTTTQTITTTQRVTTSTTEAPLTSIRTVTITTGSPTGTSTPPPPTTILTLTTSGVITANTTLTITTSTTFTTTQLTATTTSTTAIPNRTNHH
ncbi:hypothetical protein V5O48_013724 [Marasmius crinis-equi]|uniref:Glycoside hydrolase family 5 protein n=1 Tax=Marasmius crinis-equi TaxID=585013 RepID=A0ABR3EZB3_9AGAR